MREVVILKALSFDRKLEFLQTLLIAKAVTLNSDDQEGIKTYNKIVQQYEDTYNYKIPKPITAKKDITPEMFEKIVNRGKTQDKPKMVSFTTSAQIKDDLNVDISELAQTLKK